MAVHEIHRFPRTRLATFDVGQLSQKRHYVPILLECDITDSRQKIRHLKKEHPVSFNSWLLKTIGETITHHRSVAGYRIGKRRLLTFDDVHISFIVEKEVDGKKVPIPLLIKQVNRKKIQEISSEIEAAKTHELDKRDSVIHQSASPFESLYFALPGFLRRLVWRLLLRRPGWAHETMGNAVVSSVGMMGKINGWFIQTSVHPLSIGVGSIIRKPWAVGSEIKIRDILHLTVLMDHDLVDGAPMARFIQDLVNDIEGGSGLALNNKNKPG